MAPVWVTIALFSSTPLARAGEADAPRGAPLSGAAELARALELLDVPDYAGASAALERGLTAPGNDRQTLIGIHELRGIVAASLRDPDGALEAFKVVVVLDPDFQPSRDYSPRVNGPFLEARAWLAESAPLRFAPLPPSSERGVVRKVGAAVLSDPLKLARSVRFHLKNSNDRWVAEEVALSGKTSATVPLRVPGTGWWAELLGENTAVLSRIGAADRPILEGQLTPTAHVASSSGISGNRWWAIGLGGAAVAAAGTAFYFGAQSQSSRDAITGAFRDPATGRVLGITQREAFALERQAQQQAIIANVLLASSVALAGGGAAFWFLGGKTEVTPGGVRGSFP